MIYFLFFIFYIVFISASIKSCISIPPVLKIKHLDSNTLIFDGNLNVIDKSKGM